MGDSVCFEMHGEWATVVGPTSCGKYWLTGGLHHSGSGVCSEFGVFVDCWSFSLFVGGRGI